MFREFQTHSFILETRAHFYVQFENNDIIAVLFSIVSIGTELCTVYQCVFWTKAVSSVSEWPRYLLSRQVTD